MNKKIKYRINFFVVVLFMIIVVPKVSQAALEIYATDGAKKPFREDRPVRDLGESAINYRWDGNKVLLRSSRDETVEFNMVIEGENSTDTQHVSVEFNKLTGPGGYELNYTPNAVDPWDYINKEIELFFVRYVEWNALSQIGYSGTVGDQQHDPPYRLDGATRPNWHKHIPDIVAPLERGHNDFTVKASEHQAIWTDVYVPVNAPAGTYTGNFVVKVNGSVVETLPVELVVDNINLSTVNWTNKSYLLMMYNDVWRRHTGEGYLPSDKQSEYIGIIKNYAKLLHRNKITQGPEFPTKYYIPSNVDYQEGHKSDWLKVGGGLEAGLLDTLNTYYKPVWNGDWYTTAEGYEGSGNEGTVNQHNTWTYLFNYFKIPTHGVSNGYFKDTKWGKQFFNPDRSPEGNELDYNWIVDWSPWFRNYLKNNTHISEAYWYAQDERISEIPNADRAAKLIAQQPQDPVIKIGVSMTSHPWMYTMFRWKNQYQDNYGDFWPQYGEDISAGTMRSDGHSHRVAINLAKKYNNMFWSWPLGSYPSPEEDYKNVMETIKNNPGTAGYLMYNGGAPVAPTPVMESYGTSWRAYQWFLKKFDLPERHMYFSGNLYSNFFGRNCSNVNSTTPDQENVDFWDFGNTHACISDIWDPVKGYAVNQNANGDGLLMRPSRDFFHQGSDENIDEQNWEQGPIASVRLKFWRRSIQDSQFIDLATAKAPNKVKEIIRTVVPEGLYETYSHYGNNPNEPINPSSSTEIAWEREPGPWNVALEQLRNIINTYPASSCYNDVDQCGNSTDCTEAGWYWYGGDCHADKDMNVCANNPDHCADQTSCEGAGWNYCGGNNNPTNETCQKVRCATPITCDTDPRGCNNFQDCFDNGWFWSTSGCVVESPALAYICGPAHPEYCSQKQCESYGMAWAGGWNGRCNGQTEAEDWNPRGHSMPTGILSSDTTMARISVFAYQASSTCRYSTSPGVDYDSMPAGNTLEHTSQNFYYKNIPVSSGQSYNFYVRCKSGSDKNALDYPITFTVASASGSTIRADVDQSGAVTSTDAMLTLRNSLGLDMSGTNWHTSATTGDVNCDNVSNSTDAMLILRHSLGLDMTGTGWCGE